MWSDLSKGNSQEMSAHNVFDEMTRSKVEEWRSPNRILEVTIHKVCYPITEYVLRQIFGRFGKVEDVYVCIGVERVEANVVFQSKLAAAEAYGELHGRNIYNDCCQMEIKWGRHNTPKSLCAQAAPKVPPAAPATSSMTTVVSRGSEHATVQHISAQGDTTTNITKHMPSASASSTTSVPTAPAAASAVQLPAQATVICSPAPDARGAEEGISTNSPSKCSTNCLIHDMNVLKSVDILTTIWPVATFMPCSVEFQDMPKPLPAALMAVTSKLSSTSMDAQVVLGGMLQRYITSFAPAYYVGVSLLGTVTEVLEGMRSHSTVMLGSLPAHVFDIRPWPPPKEHSYNLPSETIHICLSLWPPFSKDWITVQQRPPWPPPIEMQSAGVRFRPKPWPSFCGHTVVVHQATVYLQAAMLMLIIDSVNLCMMRSLSCEFSNAVYMVEIVVQLSHYAYGSASTYMHATQIRILLSDHGFLSIGYLPMDSAWWTYHSNSNTVVTEGWLTHKMWNFCQQFLRSWMNQSPWEYILNSALHMVILSSARDYLTTIIGDSVQDQLKRGDIMLINFWSIRKQLHISISDTWFAVNLSSLHGTIQSRARIHCNVLQLFNCCYWNQWPQFSRQLIIQVYRWGDNSSCRADVTVFSVKLIDCCVWAIVQHKPPWSPSVQCELQIDGVLIKSLCASSAIPWDIVIDKCKCPHVITTKNCIVQMLRLIVPIYPPGNMRWYYGVQHNLGGILMLLCGTYPLGAGKIILHTFAAIVCAELHLQLSVLGLPECKELKQNLYLLIPRALLLLALVMQQTEFQGPHDAYSFAKPAVLPLSNHMALLQPWSILVEFQFPMNTRQAILAPLNISVLLVYWDLPRQPFGVSWCYMAVPILLLSISYPWTKVQVIDRLLLLIVESMFRWQVLLLLVASYLEIKIKYVICIKYLQAPWDPGGIDAMHRLEGKSNFKKGGMSGVRIWTNDRRHNRSMQLGRAGAISQAQWKPVLLVPVCTYSDPAHVLALYSIMIERGEGILSYMN